MWGTRAAWKSAWSPAAGFAFRSVRISGFQRKLSLQNLKRNAQTLVAGWSPLPGRPGRLSGEFQPDICVGTGGYVSGPVIREAMKLGVPAVIHEQNAYPGITNKMLAKKASRVMLAVADAQQHFDRGARCVLTGNPVRQELLRADREDSRRLLGLDARPLILSFGGSLGARSINEAVADLLVRSARTGKYQHIHGYGQYSKWMPALLKEKGLDLEEYPFISLREYIDNMPQCMAAADLVICRAGAITLSELQAQGKGFYPDSLPQCGGKPPVPQRHGPGKPGSGGAH